MQWTDEQKAAIEYSGGNVLLSAAAGSGKTAVLVERVIEKLIDPEKHVSADSILALTFTEAAAAEMHRKIADALTLARQSDPRNEYLKRQSLLLSQAHISTIHAFCLEILKSNIQSTDIPADFSIIDDIENRILLNQAVDEVLSRYYSKIDTLTGFASLTLGYGGTKGDDTLRKTVIGLYYFAVSMPSPSKWLRSATASYKSTELWEREICAAAREQFERCEAAYKKIEELIHFGGGHPYAKLILESELPAFDEIRSDKDAGYDELRDALLRLSAALGGRLPAMRGAGEDEKALGEKIKLLRTNAKAALKKFISESMSAPLGVMRERALNSYPVVKTLKNIVLAVIRKHKKLKRQSGKLDFNDLEHEALNLLTDAHGNPSATALSLRGEFSEILIDEYQDTSNLQEAIFAAIEANGNKFMVGDMKQSIYRFRNASPALFLEKYHSYDGKDGTLLRLTKNFRSRQNVVDTVNYIFAALMSEEVGDVRYSGDEMLYCGAEYPPAENGDDETEIIAVNLESEDSGARKLEAELVAQRVEKLIKRDNMRVFDRDTGETRPIEYRDIAVLMFSKKRGSIYADALSARGIPVQTDAGSSFLNTVEVQTVLSFLQIIDNPYQDIPLLAVLRSPMFGFTADKLAEIRAVRRKGNFYAALKDAAESGNARASGFLEKLNALREMSADIPIDTLIWHILNDFSYYFAVGAMDGGNLRQANLRLLQSHAADFERTRLSGLFNFMNYLETLKAADADLTPAKELEGNAVKIMTFHKSKGLEFPVVIIADAFAKFVSDTTGNIVWHEKYGIGLDCADTSRRVRYPSMPKTVVSSHIKRDELSEEMRLLYVAMTRAKEKLIVFCGYKDNITKLAAAEKSDGKRPAAYVGGCNCIRDWILPAVMPEGTDFDALLAENSETKLRGEFSASVSVIAKPAEPQAPEAPKDKENAMAQAAVAESLEKIAARLSYVYPAKELGTIPAKLSVSEIKRQKMAEDDVYVPKIRKIEDFSLRETKSEQSLERGTVTHFVMQHIDPHAENTAEQIAEQIRQMTADGMISERQAETVDINSIAVFFKGELGARLKAASDIRREFKFYTEIDAHELYPALDADISASILLQGVVDCFFIEDGGAVILDYKTDNVTRENVRTRAENYRVQLDYYVRGIEKILNMPIKGKYLYFFNCNEIIEF